MVTVVFVACSPMLHEADSICLAIQDMSVWYACWSSILCISDLDEYKEKCWAFRCCQRL